MRHGATSFRGRDLFLAQEIEVGVAAWACVDNGGKIPGKIVCVTTAVSQGEGKGNLQRDLRSPGQFPLLQGWR